MYMRAVLCLIASICFANAIQYTNPVVPQDRPDPGALYDNKTGTYYFVSTGGAEGYIYPMYASKNLASWTFIGGIFTDATRPKWAATNFWAPEIHIIKGKYVAYFTARDRSNMLNIGVAVADNIKGPYVDKGSPLIHSDDVGNIDATYYFDPDTLKSYLIWKEDGNDPAHHRDHTPIYAQELTPNGMDVVGKATILLQNDRSSWEGELIEAPWLIRHNKYHYLFYSANGYADDRYAVGVARSRNLLGPYVKYEANPILKTNSRWHGPGHCSVLHLSQSYVMLYHAWNKPVNQPGRGRFVLLDRIIWKSDKDGDGVWPTILNGTPSVEPHILPH